MTRWFGAFWIICAWLPSPTLALEPGDAFKDCAECPEMVVVSAGTFTMGSPPSEHQRADDEGPQHQVTIAKPFAVGKHEVTKGQYGAFVSDTGHGDEEGCYIWVESKWKKDALGGWNNSGYEQTDEHPVVCVNWNDAQAYVSWLSEKTGETYRLLNEAEWEYSARAGTTTPFSFGQDITTSQANFDGNSPYTGEADGIFREKTAAIGSFPSNAFGLHDFHGNVTEWVADCWNDSYDDAPSDGSARMTGECNRQVLRGGSWQARPMHIRSADRVRFNTGSRNGYIGFRVARKID